MIEKLKNYVILFLTAVGGILLMLYQSASRKNKQLELDKETDKSKTDLKVQHEKTKQSEDEFNSKLDDARKSISDYKSSRDSTEK